MNSSVDVVPGWDASFPFLARLVVLAPRSHDDQIQICEDHFARHVHGE